MRVLRINRRADYFTTNRLKFRDILTESNDLCRANKSEVERVEEEDEPLPIVIAEFDLFEIMTLNSYHKTKRQRQRQKRLD